MSKKHLTTKWWLALCIVVVIGLAVPLGFRLYTPVYWVANSKFSFQYYQPTKLPEGFKVIDKRVDVIGMDGKTYGVSADLNLRAQDWVYAIGENQATSSSAEDIQTSVSNYDPTSTGVTCSMETSPKGQSYRLCHWVDYGQISVYEVRFVKGNTAIYTQFPGQLTSQVPISSISDFVDSFKQANVLGFRVNS